MRQALYASKIVAYAQGFNQIQAGSAEYDWNVTPGDLATIWRGGCIIRAKFLNRIKEAFDAEPELATLLAAPYFRDAVESAMDSWRRVVVTATGLGIPDPGVLVFAVLLRRAAHRAVARRTDPGPARLLRRAHLWPHRRRPGPEVPHPVERRPQRSPRRNFGELHKSVTLKRSHAHISMGRCQGDIVLRTTPTRLGYSAFS